MRHRLAEAPLPAPPPAPGRAISGAQAHFIHYPLPAGMTLVAPANLTPGEQQKLDELLKTAQQLFINF
jgi:hypothetical protein